MPLDPHLKHQLLAAILNLRGKSDPWFVTNSLFVS